MRELIEAVNDAFYEVQVRYVKDRVMECLMYVGVGVAFGIILGGFR